MNLGLELVRFDVAWDILENHCDFLLQKSNSTDDALEFIDSALAQYEDEETRPKLKRLRKRIAAAGG